MSKSGIWIVVLSMAILSITPVMAEDFYVILRSSGGGFEWQPDDITIEVGDTVEFRNFAEYPVNVYQWDGDCTPYDEGPIAGQPYPGSARVTFDSGPCTSHFRDTWYMDEGVIHVVPATTPTPDPSAEFPSMSTTGLTITILIISLLLLMPVFKK